VTDPLQLAVDWKAKNSRCYWQFILWAREDIRNGCRPSIALYAELARRPHFANHLRLVRSDDKFLINNSLRADISRLLNREYDLGFPTRHSAVDLWPNQVAP
jgi:hypothetical protein